jgi:hypothetical protein
MGALLLLESVDEGFEIRMDWTALHAACAWGSLEVVRVLVEHHADVNLCSRYYGDVSGVEHAETEGPTAFHLACARGHLSVVAFLHETMGADIATMGNMYGFSLCGSDCVCYINVDPKLTFAERAWESENDSEESFGYLCFPDSYGFRGMDTHDRASEFPVIFVNACKLMTGTALMLACVRGNCDVIQYLIDAGADADACGVEGLRPLAVLKAFDHTEVTELLLSTAAGAERKGARTTPIKTRAQRAGVQLEETPPAVRRDLAEGGPATRTRAQADLRAIQKSRVQRVSRAEQASTVGAALMRSRETQRMAEKRASEPRQTSGSRKVYTCKTCGLPKKGHVCKVK